MRKWLLPTLILLLVLCVPARAESSDWSFNEEYYVLTGYAGSGGAVTVPDQIGEGTVDVIAENAIKSDNITSLTLPETLLEMRDGAVSWCGALTEVTLPESLIVIGDLNFWNCNALASVTIPAGVRYIGEYAFYFSAALKEITFEGVCPVIGTGAFSSLAEGAVAYVPDDQMEAYKAAFEAAGSEVTVQASGKNAAIIDNNGFADDLFAIDADGTMTAYYGYATYLRIPEIIGGISVKAIGDSVFRNDYYLAVLELPEGLESIGVSAFESCETLQYVSFPSTLTTIADRAFANGYSGKTLELSGIQTIGANAFESARIDTAVTLPEGLVSIGDSAFSGCISIPEFYLPSTLESIGNGAFSKNWALTYIYFDGETLPQLGENVFWECSVLADIDLNEHCTKQQMLDLQAVVDTQGLSCRVWRMQNTHVQYAERDAATYANGLFTAYTGSLTAIRPYDSFDGIDTIGIADGALKGNQTVEYFAVCYNDLFTTIGAEAFEGSSIKHVDLFDSVTTIGARAFANCTQLEELTIPESVTEIGEGAFEGLTSLRKVTILCDASLIPEGSFANCPALTEASIRQGAVPAKLFEGSALTALSLGENVTGIGARAFADTAISSVNLSNITEIGDGAFENTALTAVVLNADVNVASNTFAGTAAEIRISASATDEQLAALNEKLATPWYNPMVREGEESSFVKMPFEATSAECFDFDPETGLISAYTGTDVDVVVPREINGVTVAGFSNYNVFESCRDYTNTDIDSNQTEWVHLRTLVLPETIQSLPDELLSYMQQLETFICYAPLESTGRQLFMLCKSLDTVVFVNGVRVIDNYAFDNAGTLRNLYFGSHVDRIGESAFNFAGISSFVADAAEISYGAFSNCENLTSLHFTSKAASFAPNCVVNCPKLSEVCFDGCDFSSSETGLFFHVAEQLTVRVPEGMDDDFLNHAQNCVSWSEYESEITIVTGECAHKLPEKPDVTSLVPELPVVVY